MLVLLLILWLYQQSCNQRGCKESRCQFLVIQAFRDMPEFPRRPHLRRRQGGQRGGGAPLPPHGARRGLGDLERRLLGAVCGNGHAEVCRVLLAAGAQTEAKDCDGPRAQRVFGVSPWALRRSAKATPRCIARRGTATRRRRRRCWRPKPRSRRLFFSCVCLMASMARSVNCLGRKKAVQVHLIGAKPIVQVKR